VREVKKKVLVIAVALMAVAMLATPVMAIGPENAENNPHLEIALGGTNTQLWLPSGVMNEWINNPVLPGAVRVQVKDAAKFQIKSAIVATNPLEALMTENKWLYLNQGLFAALLGILGADPDIAMGYPDGVYMRAVYVGWSP
jgi:hypothetical protein